MILLIQIRPSFCYHLDSLKEKLGSQTHNLLQRFMHLFGESSLKIVFAHYISLTLSLTDGRVRYIKVMIEFFHKLLHQGQFERVYVFRNGIDRI